MLRSLPVLVKKITANAIDLAELHGAVVGDDTQEDLANLAAQLAEDRLAGFGEAKKSIMEFKKFRSEIVAKIESSPKFTGKTIYIFIDELDRCKPSYAIELLETLKHLFSVNGLVFVLAAHYQQLEQCVAATYGLGVDRHGYRPQVDRLEFLAFRRIKYPFRQTYV